MKRCSKCKLYKSLDDFYPSSQSKDGHSGHCKECKKLYYAADPQVVIERGKAQRARLRQRVDEWKASGCAVCGYSRCIKALDAHHLHSKVALVSKLAAGTSSLRRLNAELDKCIVLCANCHRELHEGLISLE